MVGCTRRRREDIAKANLIENLQKQAYEEIFMHIVTGGLFDYYCFVSKEKKNLKIYFELISIT